MALYEIKSHFKSTFPLSSLKEVRVYHVEANSDEEIFDYLTGCNIISDVYEVSKILRQPLATVTRQELFERKKQRDEEKAKAERKALFEKLKAEFEPSAE